MLCVMGGRRFVAAVLVTSLVAGPAFAQPADDGEIEMDADAPPADAPPAAEPPADAPPAVVKDPKVAKKWATAGNQLVAKGDALVKKKKPDEAVPHYENAVTAYEKALEAGADMNVAYALADAHDKLGHYDVAVRMYRSVVTSGSTAKPDTIKKANSKLEVALGNVGQVMLVVIPEGATISLGGNVIGTAPLPEPLIMMPGTYSFAFEADGHQPRELELTVEATSELEKTIELEKIAVVVEPIRPPDPDEPVPVPPPVAGPSKVPLIVGGVLTLGLATTAIITGVMARSANADFKIEGNSASDQEFYKDRGQRLALVTDLAIGGAVVAGGFTVLWYVFKYSRGADVPDENNRSRNAPVMSKLDVVPWVEPTASGLSVLGSF